MIAEEYKVGDATIRIHDDFIQSKEESIEILQKVTDNVLRNLVASIVASTKEETA